MKTLFSLLLACAAGGPAFAATFTSHPDLMVPDFDLSGVADTLQVSGLGAQPIRDVNVSLRLTGGWNGDYYAYLWHEGRSAILLNRVGRCAGNPDGYSEPGFGAAGSSGDFSFDDQAPADVHFYHLSTDDFVDGNLTGAWQPDGRVLDPEAPAADFDTAARPARLGEFDGLDANGPWSLYLVDASPGAMGRLAEWSITIAQVPEPGAVMLGLVSIAWVAAVLRWKGRCPRRSP